MSGPETGKLGDLSAAKAVRLVYADEQRCTGVIEGLGEAGRVTSNMAMERLRAEIPCFTPAARIATPGGWRIASELRVGDQIATRDNGAVDLVEVERADFGWRELGLNPLLRPVRIRAGAFGPDVPERDLTVSPNHRMLAGRHGSIGGIEEVLVPARHLVGRPGIEIVAPASVTYFQLRLSRNQAVLAEGCWSESPEPPRGTGQAAKLRPDACGQDIAELQV